MRNKSSLLILLAAAVCAPLASADVLTPEQALIRASELSSGPQRVRSHSASQAVLASTINAADLPAAYVFNNDGGGFMVLSADDAAPAVLGYSDSGAFDEAEAPDALRYWLQSYSEQIQWLRDNSQAAARIYVSAAPQTERTPIAPLVKTAWNQDAPFNDLCPMDNGQRCVTGCVATAMSQLLKYYNWPPTGEGSHSYQWSDSQTGASETLSFDYGATSFDWDNMTDRYSSASTAEQNQAVAQLMYACGVSVDMSYTPTGSGAQSFAVLSALTTYFRYAKNAEFLQRDFYTSQEWGDIIYDQLANYGPVIYGGQSGSDGHEFVCDGYSSDGYFHFNWGWGGMSDGYFLLDALDPGQQGIGGSAGGYNFGQAVVINVAPDRGQRAAVVPNLCYSGDFSMTPSQATLGSAVNPVYSFYSYSAGTVGVTLGLKIVSADGTARYVAAAQAQPISVNPGSGLNGQYASVTLPADLAEGSYTVYPAFSSDDAWYDFHQQVSAAQCYTMTVQGTQATFTPQQEAYVRVDDIEFASDMYAGTTFKITANVINEVTRDYYGTIYGALLQENDGSLQLVDVAGPQLVDLSANMGDAFNYVSKFSRAEAGEYYFAFLAPSVNNSNRFGLVSQPVAVEVQQAPESSQVSVGEITFDCGSQTEVPRANVGITFDVRCTQGIFYGTATYYIFEQDGSQWKSVDAITSPTLFLNAPESQTVNIKGQFPSGEIGKTYAAAVYINGQQQTNLYPFTLTGESTGIVDDAVAAEPLKVELYNLNGVKVSAKSAAPGFYIAVRTNADGTVTTRRQLIR